MLKALKVSALFSLIGFFSGLLTILLGSINNYILWLGAGVIFVLNLITGFLIAQKQGWLSVNASLKRFLLAMLIIITSYPISFLAMLGGWAVHDCLYSILRPAEWHQRVYSGDFDTGGFNIGLIFAALTGAILIGLSLRVITRRWDKQVFSLMILLGLLTIPVSIIAASLIGEPNWHLVLFPVGEMFFATLCGYWLLKATHNNKQNMKFLSGK